MLSPEEEKQRSALTRERLVAAAHPPRQAAGKQHALARAEATPTVEVSLDGSSTRLPRPVDAALYRLAQESLTNAVARFAATQTVVFGESVDPDAAIARLDETTIEEVRAVAAGIIDRMVEVLGHDEGLARSKPATWRNPAGAGVMAQVIEFCSAPNLGDERKYQGRAKDLLVIDEAWWMMRFEDTAKFLNAMTKRARKYFLGVATITQDVGDFLKSPYGVPIITNSSIFTIWSYLNYLCTCN